MINKFQQGGAVPQLGGSILQLIQQLPLELQLQLMQAFAQWAQLKGVDIQQLQQNPQALEQALGQFMQEMQTQQAQMARHGAKLQYIKSLKHQCGPDEELVYFKAGGQIGCNCIKKNKAGGKADTKKSALQQFKDKKKKVQLEKDCGGAKMKKHQIGGTIETLRQSLGLEKKNLNKFQKGGKNHWNFSERGVGNLGNGYSVTNHWIYQNLVNGLNQGDFPPTVAGRTIYTSPYRSDTLYWRSLDPEQNFLFEQVPTKSKDLKGAKQNFYKWVSRSEPESSRSNDAYQRAKRGYQNGGELPTAPRAEERYKNGTYVHKVLPPSIPVNDSTTVDAIRTNNAGFFGKKGYILRAVDHSSVNPAYNDTTYMEVPPVSNFLVKLKTRGIRKQTPLGGGSYYQTPWYYFGMFGGDGRSTSPEDALEYKTMTNRFNTAYRVSKH